MDPRRRTDGRTADDPVRATTATTLVAAPPEAVWAAVRTLVTQLWPIEVLETVRPARLVHAVALEPGGEPDGWLTWTLEAVTGGTRVGLAHAELAGPSPGPDLDGVLVLLLVRCPSPDGP